MVRARNISVACVLVFVATVALCAYFGTAWRTSFLWLFEFGPLAIIGVVIAIIVKRMHKAKTKQKSQAYTLAAFICCVLPFVPVLSLGSFVALFWFLEFLNLNMLGAMIQWMILFTCPALIIASIVLAIIAIVKRESRGEGLAIAAFYLSSFPLVHIAYISYFSLYGFFTGRKPNGLIGVLLFILPYVALPLGIVAISLAIAAIVQKEKQYVSIWGRAENNLPDTMRERRLRYRKLAIFAIVVGILEIVPGLWSFRPEWREAVREGCVSIL